MIKLICQDCRQENETERIYCRNCGTRLDRSALAKVKSTQEDSKEAHKRVRNMFDPNRARFRLMFFKVSKLILGACAAAAVIQLISPPDVPPRTKTEMLASQITFDLENAALYHRPAQLRYTEEQVNGFLGYSLKSKQSALNKPLLTFERAVAQFGEGFCRITAQRSLMGNATLSVYTGASYAVAVKDGKIVASSKGGRIGRLPVPGVLMKHADIILSDVWKALERERKSVQKLGGIAFHDREVVLTAATGTAASAAVQQPAPAADAPPATPPPASSPASTP